MERRYLHYLKSQRFHLPNQRFLQLQLIILLHVVKERDPCLAKAYQNSVDKPAILVEPLKSQHTAFH